MIIDANIAYYKTTDEREKLIYSTTMIRVSWGMLITIILCSTILSYTKGENSLVILVTVIGLVVAIINIISRKQLEKDN